jgi:hypothetical protein
MITTIRAAGAAVSYTLLEAYSEAVPIGSIDLRDEAERIWRDDDMAGRNMLAGRIQLFGPGGRALASTAEYLWCPEIGRLGIANGADADWLDADSLDEGIQDWLRGVVSAVGYLLSRERTLGTATGGTVMAPNPTCTRCQRAYKGNGCHLCRTAVCARCYERHVEAAHPAWRRGL